MMSRVVLPQSRGTRSRTAHPKIPTRNGKGIEEGGDWVVCGKTSEMGEGGGKKEVKTTEQERYHVVVNDDGSGEEEEEKGRRGKKRGEEKGEKFGGKRFRFPIFSFWCLAGKSWWWWFFLFFAGGAFLSFSLFFFLITVRV